MSVSTRTLGRPLATLPPTVCICSNPVTETVAPGGAAACSAGSRWRGRSQRRFDALHHSCSGRHVRVGHVEDCPGRGCVSRDELGVVGVGVVGDRQVSRLVRRGEGPGRDVLPGRGVHALPGGQFQHGDRGLLVAVDAEGLQEVQVGVVPGRAGGRKGVRQAVRGRRRGQRAGHGQDKPGKHDKPPMAQAETGDTAHGHSSQDGTRDPLWVSSASRRRCASRRTNMTDPSASILDASPAAGRVCGRAPSVAGRSFQQAFSGRSARRRRLDGSRPMPRPVRPPRPTREPRASRTTAASR